MTELDTAALIAEARKRADDMAGGMLFTAGETLGSRLADALEAVTAERDGLAAVIGQALSHDPHAHQCGGMAPCLRDILASAPGDVLREHDAKVWDAGCHAAEQYYKRTVIAPELYKPYPAPLNPYRPTETTGQEND